METELKLRVPPAALQRLTRHPSFKGSARSPAVAIRTVYFDTPELDLCRKAIALRVRHEGARWIQTVKWSGGVRAGLHERNEVEAPLSGPTPDYSKIVHPDIAPVFQDPQLARALQPVFETAVTRSTRVLELADGVVVEAAFDRGEIRSGDRAEPVTELELELKRGAAPALFRLAADIAEKIPVALENRSKAERGYALYRDEVPSPVKAGLPALEPAMTVSNAFAALAWSELKHLQLNEQGVLEAQDPEFLHQLRVALRRLRSALSAFASALPAASREPVARDLKWLGGALGPARDWDVFMTETLPRIREASGERAALDALAAECARLRSEAQGRTRRTIRSRKYQRVIIGTASWLAREGWREHADGDAHALLDTPIRAFAQAELERRYERVRKRGRKLGQLTGDELHQLRIAVKKMRYSIDFFASLFDAQAVRALRSRLSRLQDVLGAMNDAATLRRLTDEALGETRGAAASEARGILLGWSAGRAEALKGELDRLWKGFRRSETFW